ncbi:hypothetical protein D051_0868 [Vibrio parahaemolyticus VPCR-2010]|nr:hypothetical protein D051_0868 [Vibrio parahaemolyticus VPCR-2010]
MITSWYIGYPPHWWLKDMVCCVVSSFKRYLPHWWIKEIIVKP